MGLAEYIIVRWGIISHCHAWYKEAISSDPRLRKRPKAENDTFSNRKSPSLGSCTFLQVSGRAGFRCSYQPPSHLLPPSPGMLGGDWGKAWIQCSWGDSSLLSQGEQRVSPPPPGKRRLTCENSGQLVTVRWGCSCCWEPPPPKPHSRGSRDCGGL